MPGAFRKFEASTVEVPGAGGVAAADGSEEAIAGAFLKSRFCIVGVPGAGGETKMLQ